MGYNRVNLIKKGDKMYTFKGNSEVYSGQLITVDENGLLMIDASEDVNMGCKVFVYIDDLDGFNIVDYFNETFKLDARCIGGEHNEIWDFILKARTTSVPHIETIQSAFSPFVTLQLEPEITASGGFVYVRFPISFKRIMVV